MKVGAKTKERLSDVVCRAALLARYHRRTESFKVALLNQISGPIRQLCKAAFQCLASFIDIRERRAVVRREDFRNILRQDPLPAVLTPQFLAHQIPGDRPDPRAKIGAALKSLQLFEGQNECLLCDVVRRLWAHSQTTHKDSQANLLTADLFDEPVMIWRAGAHI